MLENFCNHKDQPAEITLRFKIPNSLVPKFKLLFICYTLGLRFELINITKESAKILMERIKSLITQENDSLPNGKVENFTTLTVSYQIDSSSSGRFLAIVISSSDLLWLHERIPFENKDSKIVSADYALRDKFIFDSFLIKYIPMKKNMSFKSSKSSKVQIKPPPQQKEEINSNSSKLSLNKEIKPQPKSEEQEPESSNVEEENKNEKPSRKSSLAEHLIQPFSWDLLFESPLKLLHNDLSPLKIKDNQISPFRHTFQTLLADSASFFSSSEFPLVLGGLARCNIISMNNIEYFYENMITSGSLADLHQIQQIDTGFKTLLGYTVNIKISLKRTVDFFLNLRNQREINSQHIDIIKRNSNQLLIDSVNNSNKIIADEDNIDKKIWHYIQLLLDSDIDGTIVHKKFKSLFSDGNCEVIIQKLSRVFRLPLFVSNSYKPPSNDHHLSHNNHHHQAVDIQFIKCDDVTNIIPFNESGSSLKQILLILSCIHRRGGGTFFIDQPENFLSLHLQNQIRRYIMQQLASKHCFFITGSPNFLPEDCLQNVVHIQEISPRKLLFTKFIEKSKIERTSKIDNILNDILLDPKIRSLLFSDKILMADGGANLRIINGLYSLIENDPTIVDTLERKLNSNGLALDIDNLLGWSVINTKAVSGIHPLTITFGYQIPSLVVSSTNNASIAGQPLSRELVQVSPAFSHISQVFGEEERDEILIDAFRDVEGLRGTLQQLGLTKGQQLRKGEQSRMQELENQLRPELNMLENKLPGNISAALNEFGIYSWENGIGHMIAKTPKAASILFSAYSKNSNSNIDKEVVNDQSQAQQWLHSIEADPLQCDLIWRNLPLSAIKKVVKSLISEENEEFLQFCSILSRKATPLDKVPLIFSSLKY